MAAATDSEFSERRDKTLGLIRRLRNMDTAAIAESVRQMKEDREHISDILDIMRMWFRDVLCYKATREVDQLIFAGEISEIRAEARASSYAGLQEAAAAADRVESRLRANVNFELTMELFLFSVKENCHS